MVARAALREDLRRWRFGLGSPRDTPLPAPTAKVLWQPGLCCLLMGPAVGELVGSGCGGGSVTTACLTPTSKAFPFWGSGGAPGQPTSPQVSSSRLWDEEMVVFTVDPFSAGNWAVAVRD